MTTITINANTKEGKSLLEIAKNLSAKDSGITIIEDVVSKEKINKMAMRNDPNAGTLKAVQDSENGIKITKTIDFQDFMDNVNS